MLLKTETVSDLARPIILLSCTGSTPSVQIRSITVILVWVAFMPNNLQPGTNILYKDCYKGNYGMSRNLPHWKVILRSLSKLSYVRCH